MKVAILTSNHYRHKYLANSICENFDSTLVISETQSHSTGKSQTQRIELGEHVYNHFQNIQNAERELFGEHTSFRNSTSILPVNLGEVNNKICTDAVREFSPDVAIVFGSSWIKSNMLNVLPFKKTINIHMGISPFYRGHSTNFWSYFNEDAQYSGATLLSLDPELDKGEIVQHIQVNYEKYDDYYLATLGIVQEVADSVLKILNHLKSGGEIKYATYPTSVVDKYYESKDFTDTVAKEFLNKRSELYPNEQPLPFPGFVPLTLI